MSELQFVQLDIEDRIAKVTLNRPDFGNAMNLGLVKDLARAALACDNDRSVKAVLISARGKMFCVGGDLKAFSSLGAEVGPRLKEMADELHKAISLFARMPVPVVIAVNGTAAGAGFSLSLAGDYVLAAQSAKFTMAYTAAGLTPDGGATYSLPRLVGLRKAQDLVLTNRVLTAQEAADWGLISRVVADEELEKEAMTVCRKIAEGPARAQAVVKRLLLDSLRHGIEEQMEIEAREISSAATTPDGMEGIRAFIEKRKPKFE